MREFDPAAFLCRLVAPLIAADGGQNYRFYVHAIGVHYVSCGWHELPMFFQSKLEKK
jgi:hypothetical protein